MSDPSKRTQNKNKYHKKTDDTQYDLTVLKTTKKNSNFSSYVSSQNVFNCINQILILPVISDSQ